MNNNDLKLSFPFKYKKMSYKKLLVLDKPPSTLKNKNNKNFIL
mgnify:FL=1|jgi:hypothetical protein|tara:strand:+ start:2029 stop:2157 length:129 start_codon:yes stop_codon:yes gene_type:complete